MRLQDKAEGYREPNRDCPSKLFISPADNRANGTGRPGYHPGRDNAHPMDGNTYYFPKADGTEVYCKQWLQNGTTRILTFKPVFEDNPNNVSSDTEKLKISLSDDVTDVFMKRFDELEKRIDDLISKKSTARAKKESGEE